MNKSPHGKWYSRLCKMFPAEDESLPAAKLVEEEKRHMAMLHRLAAESPSSDASRRLIEKHNARCRSETRKHDMNRRRIQQPSFTDAVEYLGMDITPKQAVSLASTLSASTLMALLFSFIVLRTHYPWMGGALSTYMLPSVIALPLALFALLSSYPETMAKRVRIASIGRTPEPINYMTMSLRTSPSLERAVIFAGEHSGEPISSSLKKVVWDVVMRKHSNVEDSLSEFAYQCGKWNEEMKRALYLIRGAVLETSREGFERGLDKAHDVALSGAKERVEDFASRLSGPATVLFAMGVILPMLVGAIAPLQGMQMPTGVGTQTEPGSPFPLIITMDVVFPLATFLYAYSILGKRPGTIEPPQVELSRRTSAFPTALLFATLPMVLYFLPIHSPLAGSGPLGHLPMLLSLSLFAGVYLLISSNSAQEERKKLLAMERDLPDALFQLGSRIAEGKPLETAFETTARTMDDSPLSPMFREISTRMSMNRRTLEEVLFGGDGVLRDNSSRALQASMRSTIEAVKKDPVTAGKTIIQTANYMKDLRKVDHEIRIKLQGVVDMMRATAIFFAPVVMGVTIALYALLAEQFSLMGSQPSMSASDFAMVLGVFLFLSSMISAYFVSGISWGNDRIAFRRSVGIFLPLSMLIFIFSVLGGGVLIS